MISELCVITFCSIENENEKTQAQEGIQKLVCVREREVGGGREVRERVREGGREGERERERESIVCAMYIKSSVDHYKVIFHTQ